MFKYYVIQYNLRCTVFSLTTGKTLLAKAVANQTSATFLRVCGSELIQKYLVRNLKIVCIFWWSKNTFNPLKLIVRKVELLLHDDKCDFWDHFKMAIFSLCLVHVLWLHVYVFKYRPNILHRKY